MGRKLEVTAVHDREFRAHGHARHAAARRRSATTFIFVAATLGIFNVTYALLLALVTTALPQRLGAFFRAVWLLPRMSPSVVYALLWLWVVDPTEYGLLNQIVIARLRPAADRPANNQPMLVDRPRQRLHRRLVRHDHLHARHPLDSRAPVPCRARRRRRRARHRPPRHAAGDPLAAQLHDDLPDALAAGELRIHLADHRRRAVLRHHGLRALRLPARLRERPVRLRRGAVAGPGRRSASSWRSRSGASSTCARCCRSRGSRCTDGDASLARMPSAGRAAPTGSALGRARVGARGSPGNPRSTPSCRSARCRSWCRISGWSSSRSPAAPAASQPTCCGARCAVIVPAVLVYCVVHLSVAVDRRCGCASGSLLAVVAAALLAALIGGTSAPRQLALPVARRHRRLRSKATASARSFPACGPPSATRSCSRWSQMVIVLTVARSPATTSRASLSRAATRYLKGLLVLHAFPAMTLIIPIFLMLYWIGLLDTLTGVILVVAALELPFCDLRHEGLLRRRALGHRDERHDRRRVAAAGVPPGRAAAGARRHDRDRHLRLPPRLGGIRLRPHAS